MLKKIVIVLGLMGTVWLQAQEDGAWPFEGTGQGTFSIVLMGDTNISYREDPSDAFKQVQPTLDAADFVFLNLEGAFAGGVDDTLKTDIPHKNWRHSNPDQVRALLEGGIDAVGVANNVTYPWQALMRSLKVLDSVGIPYTGGGKDVQAAHEPVILEKNGLKIGFIQYAATVFPTNHAATEHQPGIAQIKVHTAYQPPKNLDKPGQPPLVVTWMDEASKALMIADIKQLRKEVAIVIVSCHWGISGSTAPVSYQGEIARTVIDAGADLVFGHGPHTYQKIETYKGKPIMHSLGQGVFDDRRNDRWLRHREGLMAHVLIKNAKVISVSLVPTWREQDNFVRMYDPNKGKGKELYEHLKSVNTDGAPLQLVGKEIELQGLK